MRKCTSFWWSAENSFTGTLTKPKVMEPAQIALAIDVADKARAANGQGTEIASSRSVRSALKDPQRPPRERVRRRALEPMRTPAKAEKTRDRVKRPELEPGKTPGKAEGERDLTH